MVGWVLAILGLGALLAVVLAVVVGGLLLGPLLVWLSWNVLDLGHAQELRRHPAASHRRQRLVASAQGLAAQAVA
jgi:hypothetical protein